MQKLDKLNISGIDLSPRSKKITNYNARVPNPSTSRKSHRTPYVPTYFTKVRKYEVEPSRKPQTEKKTKSTISSSNKGKMISKKVEKKNLIRDFDIKNKILPDEKSTILVNGTHSGYNSFNNMNYDMEEQVSVNPTDPHDRIVFKEPELSFYHKNEGALLDESGLSMLEKLGPQFFEDKEIDNFYFKKAIREAKPFETVKITANNSIHFDVLRIPHPMKIVGNGKTTIYIDDCIELDFGSIENYIYMDGFGDENYECGGYLHKTKGNRVIFENLRIIWKPKKNKKKGYRKGISQIMRSSVRSKSKKKDEYSLFDLRTDNQIEFIDCQIKMESKIGDEKIQELRELDIYSEEGSEVVTLIEEIDDSDIYYIFDTNKFKKFNSTIFFKTSFAEGFTTIKSKKIKNLVIDNAYFTKFSSCVLKVNHDDGLVFRNSKIMYQKSLGIILDLTKHSKKENQNIVIENSDFDKNEASMIYVVGKNSKKKLNHHSLIIKDCSFQHNTGIAIELKYLNLKHLEIRDCDFFRSEANSIFARDCQNLKILNCEFSKIEADVIKLNGCEGIIQESKFSDVVSGIVIQNLGLGSPLVANFDLLIQDCKMSKCLTTGISLIGVGISSTFIKNCTILNSSVGFYIEEVQPYGIFKKKQTRPIKIHHCLIAKMRQACLAVKRLYSPFDFENNVMKGRNNMEIMTEDEENLKNKMVQDLAGYHIYEILVELFVYENLKKKEEEKRKKIEERKQLMPMGEGCILI